MEKVIDEKVNLFREKIEEILKKTVFEDNSTVKSRQHFAKAIKKAFKSANIHIQIEDITFGAYNMEITKALFRITNLETGKIGMLKYDTVEDIFKFTE